MELITWLKGPAALATTVFMGYWCLRCIIWMTQRHDE